MKRFLGILALGLLLTQFQYQTLKASNHEIMNGVDMAAVVYDGEDLLKAQIIKTPMYADGCWSGWWLIVLNPWLRHNGVC